MENILDILATMQRPKPLEEPKRKILNWQAEALEAIKKLKDSEKYRGSIFKAFKTNIWKARIALSDCNELNKNFALYFLKVFSELSKKNNTNSFAQNHSKFVR